MCPALAEPHGYICQMGDVRLGLVSALLVLPLSACALLIDTDALEGNGTSADSGASADGSTFNEGGVAPGGDGSPSSDGSNGPPSDGVVHLATKNIYGAPGASFVIRFDGGPPAANLSLQFRNSANDIAYKSAVSTSGSVTLPTKAGVYGVELRDTGSGLVSYGQATVTNIVSGFTSIQETTLPAFSPFASIWPEVSMATGDVTGDGHPDLLISSGYAAADGSVSNAGIYIYPWSTTSSTLVAATPIALSGRLLCGIALLDIDGDGDSDIVFADNVNATYAFDICSMTNNGSGSFSAPSCVQEIGTSTAMFRAIGGIALADFDRDGHMDLVVSGGTADTSSSTTTTKDVRVYRNTGGSFSLMKTISVPSTVAFTSTVVGDLNDDGELDIVTNGGSPSAAHIFMATGDFSFADATQLTGNQTDSYGGFYTDQVTLGYLNTDTTMDILLSHTNGPSSVFFSGSAGYALSTIPDFSEQHGARFHVLDLNIDGVEDIILPYKNRLLANNTYGALWANANNITTTAAPATTNSIYGTATTSSWVEGNFAFDDFDNDGKIDAVNFATYVMMLEGLKGH